MNILLLWYVGINVFSFLSYGVDKKKAINNDWRISEKFLLLLSVFGGGVGSFFGMRVFHHKTQKMIFRIWVPLWIVLHVALLLWGNEKINFTESDDGATISVIGRADGPTSIFIAGKIGDEKEHSESLETEEKTYINPEGENIEERIIVPDGYKRMPAKDGSFANFVRQYSLKKDGAEVLLYDGRKKGNQNAHIAVFNMPIENYDLQQCADSVIRMYAEYFWEAGQQENIAFHFTNGFLAEYSKWREGNRISVNGNDVKWTGESGYDNSYEGFVKYLQTVFMYAGTLSMEGESIPVELKDAKVGDVFLKGASPGHVVMICDVCENEEGKRAYLLCQGYMPAQEFHVLKNYNHEENPWYYEDEVVYPLRTPEYTFNEGALKRLVYVE